MWMSAPVRKASDDVPQTQRYKGASSTHRARGRLRKIAEQPQKAEGISIKTDEDRISNPVLGRSTAIIRIKLHLLVSTDPSMRWPRKTSEVLQRGHSGKQGLFLGEFYPCQQPRRLPRGPTSSRFQNGVWINNDNIS